MKMTVNNVVHISLLALLLQSTGLTVVLHKLTDRVHHCHPECHAFSGDGHGHPSRPDEPTQDAEACPVCEVLFHVAGKYVEFTDPPDLGVTDHIVYLVAIPPDNPRVISPVTPFSARPPPGNA